LLFARTFNFDLPTMCWWPEKKLVRKFKISQNSIINWINNLILANFIFMQPNLYNMYIYHEKVKICNEKTFSRIPQRFYFKIAYYIVHPVVNQNKKTSARNSFKFYKCLKSVHIGYTPRKTTVVRIYCSQ